MAKLPGRRIAGLRSTLEGGDRVEKHSSPATTAGPAAPDGTGSMFRSWTTGTDLAWQQFSSATARGRLLKVLFVTTEMDDFVRVGGLAAVSAALPRALRRWTDVRVLLPGYSEVIEQILHLEIIGHSPAFAEMPACSLGLASTRDGLPVYVVLCPELYDRPGNPYGDENGRDWPDNDIRFGRLASVAAQLAAGTLDKNWAADLVHANDWQAALVPAYLAWSGSKIPSILTIHNLAYQGLFSKASLRRIGAPADAFHIDGLEFYDKLSFLKGGLNYASHLTTVSETYAKEITTPELGCGMEGLLRRRSDARQLTGILNGIDESWDPRVDSQLAQQFAAGDWVGKQANADYVRHQFGLALSRGPLFGLVARLVHQKGIDLVLSATDEIINAGGQIVITGRGAPAPARRNRRGDRLQRRSGAADLCRQRLHLDALALRAMRLKPDVCTA